MTVPAPLMRIFNRTWNVLDADTAEERDEAAVGAVLEEIERSVYAGFVEADSKDLNALTADELTSLVMNAIRGES